MALVLKRVLGGCVNSDRTNAEVWKTNYLTVGCGVGNILYQAEAAFTEEPVAESWQGGSHWCTVARVWCKESTVMCMQGIQTCLPYHTCNTKTKFDSIKCDETFYTKCVCNKNIYFAGVCYFHFIHAWISVNPNASISYIAHNQGLLRMQTDFCFWSNPWFRFLAKQPRNNNHIYDMIQKSLYFLACIGNCIILTEILTVFKICDGGWLVQSLSLSIQKKRDKLF